MDLNNYQVRTQHADSSITWISHKNCNEILGHFTTDTLGTLVKVAEKHEAECTVLHPTKVGTNG